MHMQRMNKFSKVILKTLHKTYIIHLGICIRQWFIIDFFNGWKCFRELNWHQQVDSDSVHDYSHGYRVLYLFRWRTILNGQFSLFPSRQNRRFYWNRRTRRLVDSHLKTCLNVDTGTLRVIFKMISINIICRHFRTWKSPCALPEEKDGRKYSASIRIMLL